jgi:hypothetical protein
MRRIWRVMVPPELAFHSQTLATKFLRPRSWRRQALLLQLALDHDLGGDAGVVGAGHPQRVVAAHAVVARQRVHDGLVERVAHVQRAGDVGRRQLDVPRNPARPRPACSHAGPQRDSMAAGSKDLDRDARPGCDSGSDMAGGGRGRETGRSAPQPWRAGAKTLDSSGARATAGASVTYCGASSKWPTALE